MAKYDKKAALKIMIEAVKQYEEKLNDKQFLIIYRERKDIKTVNVGFLSMISKLIIKEKCNRN